MARDYSLSLPDSRSYDSPKCAGSKLHHLTVRNQRCAVAATIRRRVSSPFYGIAVRLLPAELIFRQKMGFAMPLPRWFHGELGITLEGLMNESVAAREGRSIQRESYVNWRIIAMESAIIIRDFG